MSVWSKLRGASLIFLFICSSALPGQTGNKETVSERPLQQLYNDAQKLQGSGRLDEAAEQYRAFLAYALGELALGYSLAGDYTQAATPYSMKL